jgi:hypothetical protein
LNTTFLLIGTLSIIIWYYFLTAWSAGETTRRLTGGGDGHSHLYEVTNAGKAIWLPNYSIKINFFYLEN